MSYNCIIRRLIKNGHESSPKQNFRGASYLKIRIVIRIWGEEILYRKYSGRKVFYIRGKVFLDIELSPWGVEFYIENLPWGEILYIENHPEGRFSIEKTFRGDHSLWGMIFSMTPATIHAVTRSAHFVGFGCVEDSTSLYSNISVI